MSDEIDAFHVELSPEDRAICDLLRAEIDRGLPGAEARNWHGHTVWFIEGNPIAGYKRLKDCIRLLFWSGQDFASPGLRPEGKFQAAEARYRSVEDVDVEALRAWLTEAPHVQWDYKNIVRRKGRLERLV